MVEWSIEAFRASPSVRSIVVAVPPGNEQKLGGGGLVVVEDFNLDVVEGGATRSQSVSNGLGAVGTELVAIHDAARPLVTPELIEGVVATLIVDPDASGAIAATPVTNTIKRVASDRLKDLGAQDPHNPSIVVEDTLDRARLWTAQTPQVFRVAALREALATWPERAAAGPEGVELVTDEAMLVEAAGGRVLIHPSPPENLKVTTLLDLKLAELLLAGR